ncbi:threonine synthase [Streptomyces iconiensis]|uniref:Pyridoxal-phosphate dependent enzyme n=1 Tax=Streptomyces iconiensis TaxID=1384038 RepID=A0ABT7A551_9ACTN|nr:pyridoxal-phosphate dependent enzyme [Streptomyces iconiensis]MDJ1136149.1 pyridoxal-phosphate dependent enzyme [Streptomyces iconiensis]
MTPATPKPPTTPDTPNSPCPTTGPGTSPNVTAAPGPGSGSGSGSGNSASLATAQRSLGDPALTYPLWPPLTAGCPRTSTDEVAFPVEVDYAYDQVDPRLFAAPVPGRWTGIDHWAPLLPPLMAPGMGEGRTPLVEIADGVYVKDESRNPTWSHKDRLNRVTASAALRVGAPGTVVASSGNHAASAAAFAARAGLRCVVLASADSPPAVASFVRAYGAVVLPVPAEARWPLARMIAERCGFHPVTNLTRTHTGHAFGPEGYKTIAYEIHAEIGVPAAVFVPTGYGEMLFGVWKGFTELRRLGLTDRVPRMYAAEPDAGGPLHAALAQGRPAARVDVGATDAYGIDCAVGGYRGVLAVRDSGGAALLVSDAHMREAQRELAANGMWAELSGAAGLAAHRAAAHRAGPHADPGPDPDADTGPGPDTGAGSGAGTDTDAVALDGPVVCVSTSSGFKDRGVGADVPVPVDPSWEAVAPRLRAAGIGM